MVRHVSLRPAPTSPAKHRTSPFFRSKETSLKPVPESPSTRSTMDPEAWGTYSRTRSRPTIILMTDPAVAARKPPPCRRSPIPQDGDAVGDPQHFFDLMRDIDDGHPAALQRFNDREEAAGFRLAQGGVGLVHDDERRLDRERLGDLDELALGDAQAVHETAGGRCRDRRRPALRGFPSSSSFHNTRPCASASCP